MATTSTTSNTSRNPHVRILAGVVGITPQAAKQISSAISDFSSRVSNLRIDLSDEAKKLDNALKGSNSQQQFRNLINNFNQDNIKIMSELNALDKKVAEAYKQYATIDKNVKFDSVIKSYGYTRK